MQRTTITDIAAWTVALLFAAMTGWLQIMFRDLHLALLAAMVFGLTVALVQPKRPWLWGIIIGLSPAAAEFYRLYRGEPVRRGAIEVAFGALLPAFVGAIGGTALRVMVRRLFEKSPEQNSTDRVESPQKS